jgi:hypothetical protein
MGAQSVQMKRVLPWLVRHDVTRDFGSALAALDGPIQNIFLLTVHYFHSFVPIDHAASLAGSRAGSPVS